MLSAPWRLNLVTMINRGLWLHCSPMQTCVWERVALEIKTACALSQPFVGKHNSRNVLAAWSGHEENVFDEDYFPAKRLQRNFVSQCIRRFCAHAFPEHLIIQDSNHGDVHFFGHVWGNKARLTGSYAAELWRNCQWQYKCHLGFKKDKHNSRWYFSLRRVWG